MESKVIVLKLQRSFCIFCEFERESKDELWDTEEEFIEFFQDQYHFPGIIEGHHGSNLLQTYKAKIWRHCFEQLSDITFSHATDLLLETKVDGSIMMQFEEIERFC